MTRPDAATKGRQVLAVLADGPATTGEVAAELGWPTRLTCAHLNHLMSKGTVTRNDFHTGNRRVRFLWMLVEASRA
jgi:predicted ArsR family transcriptional regulator